MRVRFTFAYGAQLDADQEQRLAGVLDKPVERNPEDASWEPGKINGHTSYEGDLEAVLGILGRSARIEVQGMGAPAPLQDIKEALDGLVRRMDASLSERTRATSEYVNTRVSVHVPGNALLGMDEVVVQYDMCTEALQDELDAGWRIVAVCPQPNQRRPDYVLGRVKPKAALPAPAADAVVLPAPAEIPADVPF